MPGTNKNTPGRSACPDELNANVVRLGSYWTKLRLLNQKKPQQTKRDEFLLEFNFREWEEDCKILLICILSEADFTFAFSNTGIPSGSSFGDETLRIIKGKILPYLHDPEDASAIIHEVFNQPDDHYLLASLFKKHHDLSSFFTDSEKQGI